MPGTRFSRRLAFWPVALASAALVAVSLTAAPLARAQSTPAPLPVTSTRAESETMADPVTVTGTIVFPEHVPEGPPRSSPVRRWRM